MQDDLFEQIARVRRERIPAALATVVAARGSTPAKVPARMLILADGRTIGTIGGGCVEAEVMRAARDAMDTGRPRTLTFRLSGEQAERTGIACGGILEVMLESLDEPRVVIVGAGHVGQAVAELAARAGFHVTVVDDRPDFASQARFPSADEILVTELDGIGARVQPGPSTHVLVMTRGHAEDLSVLPWALRSGARTVGVLGSRAKRVRFEQELRGQGLPAARVAALRMPVGLDIGAETVPEIAISIVAQLVSDRRGSADRA